MNNKTIMMLILLAAPLMARVSAAQESEPPPLAAAVVEEVEQLVAAEKDQPISNESITSLFRTATIHDGSVKPLLDWLSGTRGEGEDERARRLAEIEVHVAARRGELRRSLEVLTKILFIDGVADKRVDLRLWQARLYDALGQIEDAKDSYESLITADLSADDQQKIRLRLALMGLLGEGGSKAKSDTKKLVELAEASDDVAFRNRAAIVLAVQNQFAEAVKLFTIGGEKTDRFRSASRVAEWAIRANDRDKAIESAWDAVRSSQLKRDRRYALALLVEAYRLKEEKKGLAALADAFAKEDADRGITAEMKAAWIELLGELGRHDDAIKLFKSTANPDRGFTVEMRRELLEMEGAAGRVDRMIESYRELIAAEPDVLAWRGGLTRILLERGEDQAARELWTNFLREQQKSSQLLPAAQTLGELGLDDLSAQAVERMVELKSDHGQALLFLSELQQQRGRLEEAEAILDRLHAMKEMPDTVRSELASAYERVGRQDRAIEVMEAIREERETVAEDLELRLAWLYSEIGDEDKALKQWLALWRKVNSVPRRRYVEDRLMTVSSRLGSLADIAIELEEKLMDGQADEREAGLLVRIYSRVNDSVAASEILEEYMTQAGRDEVDRLQEKGRIYQICNDYWSYEKVIERLIEVDPEGKTEYLRQLALSMLERGKAQDARKVLLSLRDADDGKDSIGGEFEAGVLSLVGLNREAADAYRRAIATYPDRIEAYLLLANQLKDMGDTARAVGMFQYLAENAERDDLFTIAIDGLLNMEARGNAVQWARRITLERLAGREDKNYLYQLLSDLSAEVNDKAGQIRALENSLAVSGNRRLSVLRECMELSSRVRGGVYYSSSSRGPNNGGNKPFFAFGRRLIALGEVMPPQVFLDLGQAFLAEGDVTSAERTFGLARNLADERSYQRQVATIFEKAGRRAESLVRYERLLRTNPSDVALIARVSKLNEQEGRDEVAARFYERGMDLLFAQTPLTTREESSNNQNVRYYSGNRDSYQTYADRLLRGLLVTLGDLEIEPLLVRQQALLDAELEQLAARSKTLEIKSIADSPRIDRRSSALRRLYFSFDRIDDVEALDSSLLAAFAADDKLSSQFAKERLDRGRYDSVRRLRDATNDEKQKRSLSIMLGELGGDSSGVEPLDPKEMWRRLLPVWMSGEVEEARKVLRRVDRNKGASQGPGTRVVYTVVNGVLVPMRSGSGSDISAWMRLARMLGDENLALQFARSGIQRRSAYGVGVKQIFETYEGILPADSFQALARFAANLYKEDKTRTADYFWLLTQLGDELPDRPTDEELLELIEDRDLRLTYRFPFSLAYETFPESIRVQALGQLVDSVDKKSRPRELARIPFQHAEPLGKEVGELLLQSIKSGIQPALQEDYLRYASYYLPRQNPALQCEDNADIAIAVLDLLNSEEVRGKNPDTAKQAQLTKAMVLHQLGKTDEALDIALQYYDPQTTTRDYYLRNAMTWMQRELTPIAPERFLAVLDKQSGGTRTVQNTDRRLVLLRSANDETQMRAAYEEAWKRHPKETKYARQYEQWEQRSGRVAKSIAINERLLEQLRKQDDDSAKAAIPGVQKRLADLWFSLGNPVRGLQYWRATDDADIARFASEKKAREKMKDNPPSAPTKPSPANPPSRAARIPALPLALPGGAMAMRSGVSPSVSSSITTVRDAIKAGDTEKARIALRQLWRAFPPVEESPYGRIAQKNINGLRWPNEPTKKEAKPPSDEDRAAARKAARDRLRGGLATFDADVKPAVRRSNPVKSVWGPLSEHDFGGDEMNRILRSRTPLEMRNLNEVILGRLAVQRRELGDDAVFDALATRIQSGQAGDPELISLFAMLDEDPQRIDESNRAVVDHLTEQLDLTNLKLVSQLAKVCGSIDQRARSSSLYIHAALLAPGPGVTFKSLVDDARQVFGEENFMPLVERMFAATKKDDASVPLMLDLRMETLTPQEAHDRSSDLFASLDADPASVRIAAAVRGAVMYARVGRLGRAQQCLRSALLRNHQASQPRTTTPYGTRRETRLSTYNMNWLFPADTDSFADAAAWLAAASGVITELLDGEQIAASVAVPMQLRVAMRQNDLGLAEQASETLASVDTHLAGQSGLRLLAIDLLRQAERFETALTLESTLYESGQLNYVRLGDLLRDTSRVHGRDAAMKLLDQLLKVSVDEDLLAAAKEVAASDETRAAQIETIRAEATVAANEREERQTAARERQQTRAKWQAADRERAKKEQPATSKRVKP
ncbi:MAG: hypothetical protein QF805_01760 [Pirellulaceae bacterium]|nr:hypothetical protein [Pirellulaceae bacterium]